MTLYIYNEIMPSSIKRIGGIVVGVLSFIQDSYGELSDSNIFDLKVILNEMVLNAVKHGNNGDETKLVKISAEIRENDLICFTIEDEGKGYIRNEIANNEGKEDRSNDISDLQECGRGLLIVNGLCDSICFDLNGSRTIIIKKLVRL
jgi:serine/threonine-protein kinase RsbW